MARPDPGRRWDTDQRGIGVADAAAFAPRVEALAEASRETGWIAEEPELHLWPHLERAIAAAASPWRLVARRSEADGSLVLELEHGRTSGAGGPGAVRADAFALLGTVAEGSTFVEVSDLDEGTQLIAVTGSLPDGGVFSPHGHTLRLIIRHVNG